jgi:TatD DNase family protein
MILIDTHTHLYLSEFDNDRNKVVEQAIHCGVQKMLLPNVDSQTTGPMLELCQAYPEHCFAMMGLHPTSVNENIEEELQKVEKLLSEKSFIAVGEVGLDLYWDKTFFAEQCHALEFQIALSRKHKLPLVLHTRDAFPEMLDLLNSNKNEQPYRGVLHSFAGTPEQAAEAIALGFYIGLNGVITFKNSKLTPVIEAIPMKKILLETDAPYLTPAPHRGKRNESSYLHFVAAKVAEVKNISIEEVAQITTGNANALFF